VLGVSERKGFDMKNGAYDIFFNKLDLSLRAALSSLTGLKLLSREPRTDDQGWYVWNLTWEVGAGEAAGNWNIEFSANQAAGTAMVEFTPEGWTAPGLNSSSVERVGTNPRDWDQFQAKDLIRKGVLRAVKYRYFQEPLRSKYMKNAGVQFKDDSFAVQIDGILRKTAQVMKLVFLDSKPIQNAQGWWIWDMSQPAQGGKWEIQFMVNEEQRVAMVEVQPFGWLAPNLTASARQFMGSWKHFSPGALINQGIKEAEGFKYFQEPYRSQHMKSSRVAQRWENRQAGFPATAFVRVDKSAIFFGFEVVIPRMGSAEDISGKHVPEVHNRVKAAVDALNQAFGGKSKIPPILGLFYSTDDDRLLISEQALAATGVFGLDVHAVIERMGGTESFKKAVEKVFARIGWKVESVEVPW